MHSCANGCLGVKARGAGPVAGRLGAGSRGPAPSQRSSGRAVKVRDAALRRGHDGLVRIGERAGEVAVGERATWLRREDDPVIVEQSVRGATQAARRGWAGGVPGSRTREKCSSNSRGREPRTITKQLAESCADQPCPEPTA